MSEKAKLDNLIKKILKEEIDNKISEEEIKFKTPDGTERTATPDQKNRIRKEKPGTVFTYTKEEKEEDMDKQPDPTVMRETPVASEIAGKVSEIIDSLKAIAEAGKDNKHKRHAEKAMKYMEAAKSALEGLTAHEAVLEKKERAVKEKDATKDIKSIEKALGKIVRDKDTISKMMKKMPIEKVLAMKDKMKGEMDETKVAKAMLNVALRESVSKK